MQADPSHDDGARSDHAAAAGVLVERDGTTATITLDRPAVRNAFDDQTIAALTTAFGTLGADARVRCIVLAAVGPAFCAGADLAWMRRMALFTDDENVADAAALATLLRSIDACPVPTIAKVQGDAFAGGIGLIAGCDVAVGVAGARFCLSEVRLGLVPATIAPYLLRAIGERAARRYALTAEVFDAAEALRIGLLHAVVEAPALDARVASLAAAIAQAGPAAVQATKALLRAVAGQPMTPALEARTVRAIADARASDEARAGMQAFLDKQPPPWRAPPA